MSMPPEWEINVSTTFKERREKAAFGLGGVLFSGLGLLSTGVWSDGFKEHIIVPFLFEGTSTFPQSLR